MAQPSYTITQTYEMLQDRVHRRYPSSVNLDQEDMYMLFDEVGTYIRNYIANNWIPVGPVWDRPGELFYVWLGLSIDVLKYWDEVNKDPDDSGDIDARDVASIKAGDTEVKRGISATDTVAGRTLNQHMPDLDAYVYNYQNQLNQYRRMRW